MVFTCSYGSQQMKQVACHVPDHQVSSPPSAREQRDADNCRNALRGAPMCFGAPLPRSPNYQNSPTGDVGAASRQPTPRCGADSITPTRHGSEDGHGGASCRNQKSLISIRCSMSREMYSPKGTTSAPWGPATAPTPGPTWSASAGCDSTTDRNGTGERASVENDPDAGAQSDIAADGIVEAEEAGLGGGLDQAEEAQLGLTDEEIEAAVRDASDSRRGSGERARRSGRESRCLRSLHRRRRAGDIHRQPRLCRVFRLSPARSATAGLPALIFLRYPTTRRLLTPNLDSCDARKMSFALKRAGFARRSAATNRALFLRRIDQ